METMEDKVQLINIKGNISNDNCYHALCHACNGSGYDYFDDQQCEMCGGGGDIQICPACD
jgi:rRNA maturation endonuclease Nob1